MSIISDVASLALLTTSQLEDQYGQPHPFLGCVEFGPISLNNDAEIDSFIFGVDVDKQFRQAGWTLMTKSGALGFIQSGFSIPDQHKVVDPRTGAVTYPNDAPLFEMNWLTDSEGDSLQGYNSFIRSPPAITFAWEFGSPTWIPEGETGHLTWVGILQAIYGEDASTDSQYVGFFPVTDHIGTYANERIYGNNGFFATAGNLQTAGKTWESPSLNGMKLRVRLQIGNGNGHPSSGHLTAVVTVLRNNTPVGNSVVVTLMQQPDYLFFIDAYSLYLHSRLATFHGDIYQTSRLTAAMISTSPAIPLHSGITDIPPTAIVSVDQWDFLSFGDNGNWYHDATVFEGGSQVVFHERGWAYEVIRSGPLTLLNNDGSDVIFPSKILMSTDFSGPSGALGPMRYVGNAWNCFTMQRDYGLLNDYPLDIPDVVPVDEINLPKRYKAIRSYDGSGGSGNDTQGSVLIGIVDYDEFARQSYNQPPSNPDDAPVKITLVSEFNLFTKTTVTDASTAHFVASGGRAVNPDHTDDNANYIGPQYSWLVSGQPTGWTIETHGVGNSSGVLTGSAHLDRAGRYTVSISATDTFGTSSTLQYYLVVGTSSYPQITTSSTPNGTVGTSYSTALAAYGGSGIVGSWAIASGSLPPGLTLSGATISGTPTLAGTYNFTVTAVDAVTGEMTLPASFTIVIS